MSFPKPGPSVTQKEGDHFCPSCGKSIPKHTATQHVMGHGAGSRSESGAAPKAAPKVRPGLRDADGDVD